MFHNLNPSVNKMGLVRKTHISLAGYTCINENKDIVSFYLKLFDQVESNMNLFIMASEMFSNPIKNRYINSLRFMIGAFNNNINEFSFGLNLNKMGNDSICGVFIIHKGLEKFLITEGESDISRFFMQLMIVLMLLKLCDRYKLHDSTRFFLEKRDLLLNTFARHEKYLIKMLSQKFSENIYAKKKRKENLYGL
jgi:hypothetical protein